MKTKITTLICAFAILLYSCKSASNQDKGAAIGAAAGAVIGGILGNNVGKGGNGALGAVIGAAVGGVAGGVIGNKMDKQAREIQNTLPGAQVERVGEGIKLVLGENAVRFDFNKASLTPTSKANLDKLVSVFNEYPDTNITIYGYTDSKGADDYNLKLSEQRATSVQTYLLGKGLNSSRFTISGMGEADPIGDNETDEGRALNRRVEFSIVANQKMIEDAKKEAGN